MSTQTLNRHVYAAALKKKPPKHMRQLTPETLAKAYNKKRFYEACAKRGADPVDVLARVFSVEGEDIALDRRAELALKALAWLDRTQDDEQDRAEIPRVEIVIVDSTGGAEEAPALIETVPV